MYLWKTPIFWIPTWVKLEKICGKAKDFGLPPEGMQRASYQ